MAKEVSVQVRFSWAKGGEQIIARAEEILDQTGSAAIENVQLLGTTSEAVQFGDVTDPSWVIFKNLDTIPSGQGVTLAEIDAAKQKVIYLSQTDPASAADGGHLFALNPGQSAPIPDGGVTWFAIGKVDGCKLLVAAADK